MPKRKAKSVPHVKYPHTAQLIDKLAGEARDSSLGDLAWSLWNMRVQALATISSCATSVYSPADRQAAQENMAAERTLIDMGW